ncbi:MAG TPA: YHYH protein [Rhodothermales bacterium]|nr:YHYH protein [Rhodothermales bacterium]
MNADIKQYCFSFLAPAMLLLALVALVACDSSTALEEAEANTNDRSDLPAVFQQFASTVQVYQDGDFVVLESDGVPNHESPYFNTSDSRHADYDGDNTDFQLNPNRITEQDLTLRIPLNPLEATNHEATPLGAIGMALNGVPIFNQYAGPGRPLTFEIDSFDQYNGHPQQFGAYHYHVEPVYLTVTNGRESLVGFLLDGFPVYGPVENGQVVTNADLDEFHGHIGVTVDYPDGIYHYHITAEDPYINGAGFYGTAGTVSQ